MKKLIFLNILISFFCSFFLKTQDEHDVDIKKLSEQKLPLNNNQEKNSLLKIIEKEEKIATKNNASEQTKKEPEKCKTVILNYENEDLTNVINYIAALKCINIIFPQPPAKFAAKLTFSSQNEITLDEAWNLLQIVLDKVGFSFSRKKNTFEIINNNAIIRELLPIYINAVEKIPNTDERIRFLYFFDNINIQNTSNPSFANIDQILKEMLVNEPEPSYILDTASNSLLITNRASAIKGVMRIIEELDKVGFRESIEVIELINTKSDFIVTLINKLMPTQEEQMRFGFPKISKLGSLYFSESTKVIPIERTNAVAILGTPESVTRVKEFIQTHLDQPIDSDKSIVHVKSLEYLEANELADVLQKFVQAKGTTSQAEAELKDALSNAIIVAEQRVAAEALIPLVAPSATQPQNQNQPKTGALMGGNNIIVAARYADWEIINRVIDEIDKPGLQVALDVLIAEIELDEQKLLGGQTRSASTPGDPNNFKYQTAHLIKPWLNFTQQTATTDVVNTERGVASDLLQLQRARTTTGALTDNLINIATQAEAGSTILSFENGNGISYVIQILNNFTNSTILSQPYIITKNHKPATISIANSRYVEGPVKEQSTGGPVTVVNEYIKADLSINILPRVSELGDINLDINVTSNNFVNEADPRDNTRITRMLTTNSNVNNNEILVLGGLVRDQSINQQTETPILAQIPIIGNIFKRRLRDKRKGSLMIFISPKIIRPKLEGGLNDYTKLKAEYLKKEIAFADATILGMNFENLRDPVTRFFFPSHTKERQEIVDDFTGQGVFGLSAKEHIDARVQDKKLRDESMTFNRRVKNIKELTKDCENPLIQK